MEDYIITDNKAKLRFEIELNGSYAFADYRWYQGKLALMHTVVPEKYEGKGIAHFIAAYIFEHAKKEGLKLLVYCPYMAQFVKKHPEYNELVTRL